MKHLTALIIKAGNYFGGLTIKLKIVTAIITVASVSIPTFTLLNILPHPNLVHPSSSALTKNHELPTMNSEVLGTTSTPIKGSLNIKIPSTFYDNATIKKDLVVEGNATFSDGIQVKDKNLDLGSGELTASNVVYSLTSGDGLSITSGQSPTIKNTGVLSLQSKTGALTLTEGTDITIDGLKITNKSDLSTVRGRGGCSSCITDADVVSGLTISGGTVNNSAIGATTASTASFTTLTASGATTLSSTLAVTGASTLTGNVTFGGSVASSIIPSSNGSYDLGSASYTFGTIYASNLSVSGVNSSGQLISTYVPTGSTVSTGSLYINPTTATSGYTLAGFAVGGTEKLRVTANGSLISGSDGSADLGSSDIRWNNLYVNTLTASGTNYNGQATFTYAPTSNAIGQGSIWINPTTATSAYPLLSLSIGGTEKARITTDGYLGLAGANNPGSSYILNAGSIFNIGTGGNVGIGASSPQAKLGILGNVGIGVSFGYAASIPVNGLAVQGNVGIGTTTATHNLEIVGTGAFSSALSLGNGTATTPGLNFSGDTDSGLWSIGTNILGLTTNGSGSLQSGTTINGLSVNANGNVGIGTSSPLSSLDVVNNINASGVYKIGGNQVLANLSSDLTSLGIGVSAGYRNTASSNTFVGYQSGRVNTTGNTNTATGTYSLYSNTTGNTNTAFGYQALYSSTTTDFNTAIGYQALLYNTSGDRNTAIGYGTLTNNTSGWYNTATGWQALYGNTSGYNNTAFGYQALYANTSGLFNTANGLQALTLNDTGSYNTADGYYALRSNATAWGSTALGYNALTSANRTADTNAYNTAVGYQAGYAGVAITTGNYDTFLGYNSGAGSATLTNATAIGAYSLVGCSNCLILGSVNGINGATSSVNVGIGTTNPSSALSVIGNVGIGTSAAGAGLQVNGGGLFGWGTASSALSSGAILGVNGNVGVGTTSPLGALHVVGQCVAKGTRIRRRRRSSLRGDGDDEAIFNGDGRSPRFARDDDYIYEDIPVEDIKPDDEVLSLNDKTGQWEWHQVEKTMEMGIQETIKIVTQSGKWIETTDEHPYLTITQAINDSLNQQRLTTFEVDQSMRVEDKTADTILAIANVESSFIAKLDKKQKQILFKDYSRRNQTKKFGFEIFARMIIATIVKSQFNVTDLIIDIEYDKHEMDIAAIIRKQFPQMGIYFRSIGKHSPAHLAAYNAHIRRNLRTDKKEETLANSILKGFLASELLHPEFTGIRSPHGLFTISNYTTKWEKVKYLKPGMVIATVDGWEKISTIYSAGRTQTYDLQIEGTHNFLANNIVAHNTYINGSLGLGTAFTGATTPTNGLAVQGNVGIGTTTTNAPLEVLSTTTPQFRLSYDGTNFATEAVSSAGALTIDTNSTGAINIGTGSNAKTVTIGNTTTSSGLTFNSGTTSQTFNSSVATGLTTSGAWVLTGNSLTSGTGLYASSTTINTGKLAQLSTGTANTLTTGTLFDARTTSTVLTGTAGIGSLINLDWSPGSATTATGDLFALNIGTNGTTTGNLFNILDASSSIFSVSEVAVTTSLPFNETAPGDVSMAYDLVFNNPTSSFIKSDSNLSIVAGESFNSSNLTLSTYNSGQIVLDSAGGVVLSQYQPWQLSASSTMAWNIQDSSGNNLLTFDTTNQRVGIGITGPASKLDVNGNVTIGSGYVRTYGAPTNGLLIQGNVGIGTSNGTGAFNLDVAGTGRFSSALSLSNGSSTTPGLNFSNLTGAGLWQSASIISLTNGGAVSGLAVNASGNVGVGTTSPLGALHVVGQCVTGDTLLKRRRKKKKRNLDMGNEKWDLDDLNSRNQDNQDISLQDQEYLTSNFKGSEYIYEDVPVEDIKPDDEVLSLNDKTGEWEWNKVEKTMDMGIQEVFRLETEGGKWIETTSNHPYLMIEEIKLDTNTINQQSQKQSYGQQRKGYYNLPVNIFNHFLGFGSHSLNKNEITAATIPLIMLPVNNFQSNFDLLDTNGVKITALPIQAADKFINSSDNVVSNLASTNSSTDKSITQVEKAGWVKVSQLEVSQYIATSDGWEKIRAITKVGRKQTYDLQIEGTHNFVGNNIVAHNTYINGSLGLGTAFTGVTTPANGLAVSGNVGIGTTTANFNLTDIGTLGVTGGDNALGTGLYVNSLGNVGIGTSVPTLSRFQLQGSGTSTGINFLTTGSNLTQGLTVLDNGNVGVGTTGPTVALDVVGAGKFSSDVTINGLTVGKGKSSLSTNTALGVNAVGGGGSSQGGNGNNTGIGYEALYSLNATASQDNTAVGYQALKSLGPGDYNYNTAIGSYSLLRLTGGGNNVAMGVYAGQNLTTGANNLAIGGYNTLGSNSTGSTNVAVGNGALFTTTGSGSVALGYFAGRYETGSNAFYVDNQDRSNTAGDKAGALLYGAFNATPSLQTLKVNAALTVSQNVGIGNTNPGSGLQLGSNAVIGFGNATSIAGPANGLAVQGNLGVGTTSPLGAFHVVGQCVTGDTRLRRRRRKRKKLDDGSLKLDDEDGNLKLENAENPTSNIQSQDPSSNIQHQTSNDYIYDDVRIDQIQPGDEILSLDEKSGEFIYQEVKGLLDMGIKQTYQLITSSGKTIRTTGNHPYFVKETQQASVIGGIFEVDQSPKLEQLSQDSFIALANKNIHFIIKISRKYKKQSYQKYQDKNKQQFFASDTFARAINALLSLNKIQPFELKIDNEYTGYETRIREIITRTNPNLLVSYRSLGHSAASYAHWAAYRAFKGEYAADLELFEEGKVAKEKDRGTQRVGLGIVAPVPLNRIRNARDLMGQDYHKLEDLSNAKWLKVYEIKPGMLVATTDGWERIVSLKEYSREQVFDIEVSGTHNFVGNDIVAHNTYINGSLGLGTAFTGVTTPSNGLAVSGNVGIGTTTANSNLTIIGGATVGADYGQYTAPTNGLLIQGNVGIGTSVSSNPLTVGTDGTNGNGAYLSAGGSWTNGSSFEFKEGFTQLNSLDILSKINSLNLTSWNYKIEGCKDVIPSASEESPTLSGKIATGSSTLRNDNCGAPKHIGPIAEEFYSVFGLGNDNKHISTIDPSGVALVGIQGLSQEISNLKFEILNLKLNYGMASTSSASISSSVATLSATVIPSVNEESSASSGKIATGSANPRNDVVNLKDQVASLSARIKELELRTWNLELGNKQATSSASLSASVIPSVNEESSTSSGKIATSSSTPRDDITDLRLTDPSILLASGSAQLTNTWKVGSHVPSGSEGDSFQVSEATISGMLKTYSAEISDSFKSFGKTSLGNTTIAGDLSVDGTLSISNGSEINVIGISQGQTLSTQGLTLTSGILYLQNSPLAQGLDIFNGKVTIDKEGNIQAQGEITVKKLTVSSDSAGTGIIPAGQTQVIITSSLLTQNSKLFVTPKKPVLIAVTDQNPNSHTFVVELDSAKTYDVKFDWWVVDSSPVIPSVNEESSASSEKIATGSSTLRNDNNDNIVTPSPSVTSPPPSPSANAQGPHSYIPDWQDDKGLGKVEITDPGIEYVNVRTNPAFLSDILTKIYPGTGFYIQEEKDGWIKIEYQPDVYGWVLGSLVEKQ